MFRQQYAILFLAIAAVATAAQAEPRARSASLGVQATQHLFVYYPQAHIYYAPTRDRWFWREDGRWQDAQRLPVHFADRLQDGVQLRLDAPHPGERHDIVRRHYAGTRE